LNPGGKTKPNGQPRALTAWSNQRRAQACGHFGMPDDFVSSHGFVLARGLQPRPEFVLKIEIHLPQHVVGELAIIGESDKCNFSLAPASLYGTILLP
jgi:hypothetical protein